jgi:glyoxylase-like metal-dependent hydrolase (beta-lactamase superfamily II)
MLRRSLLYFAGLVPLFGQIDLSGVWMPRYHEDQQDRVPGPELGDYLGLPINDAGRLSALSWDASRLTLPEEQCRVHSATYIFHGPMAFRSWEEKDPQTQQLIAIKEYTGTYQQTRTIWMDGRPHPPPYALHTWMGFSTGKWEGRVLTVTTTHIKQDWIRRNGVPQSDRTTMTEHFLRHGDYLTHVTIIDDPVNLAEPLIRTEDFVLELEYRGSWLYPCEPVAEIASRNKRDVAMHQPGENPFVKEFQTRHHVSEQAAMGGPESIYPEYRAKLSGQAAAALSRPAPRVAQRARMTEDGEIHVQPVQGNISMLVGPAGNSVVQVGSQGVLVVDTMTAALSERLLAALGKLSEQKIQYIINTSADPAHIGGNQALRKAGITVVDANAPGSFMPTDEASGAAILAHDNVLKRMSAPASGFPQAAWPTSTLEGEDEKSLFFNGEAIRILPHPAANSDSSVTVFFRRSDVISTGDIFSTTGYPVIDVAHGGSVGGIIDALNRIIDLAVPAYAEEGGTLIIPGHGRLCDRSDVVVYRDMLAIVRGRIAAMKKKGYTLEQVQAARPTMDYDPLYGSEEGPWTTAMFVEAVYRSIM